MVRKKREFTTFSLSFLDIMSCGFGAVILVYLIMNHSIDEQKVVLNQDLQSEVNLLEEDVAEDAPDTLFTDAAATEAAEAKKRASDRRAKSLLQGYTGNSCSECQNFTMVRNGTCEKCDTCGSTSGCS